jgi:hypothetical protein
VLPALIWVFTFITCPPVKPRQNIVYAGAELSRPYLSA